MEPTEVFRFAAPCANSAACMRCPQIVTENYFSSEQLRQAADPAVNLNCEEVTLL